MRTTVFFVDPQDLAASLEAFTNFLEAPLNRNQKEHVSVPVPPPEPVQETPTHADHVLKNTDLLLERIHATGVLLEKLIGETERHLNAQFEAASPAERQRIYGATPHHFVRCAKAEFQTGLMCLERAVKQPSGF